MVTVCTIITINTLPYTLTIVIPSYNITMDGLTLTQQIQVLSYTLDKLYEKSKTKPLTHHDVLLKERTIRIRQHLINHEFKLPMSILSTCNYCLSDYRHDIRSIV